MRKVIRYFLKITLLFTIMLFGRPLAFSEMIMADTVVTLERAIKDAEKLISLNNDWKVMLGSGESMLPIYGDNPILIVDTAAYHNLKIGMSVVYRDNQGDLIGHLLRRKVGDNWYAQGFNNKNQDPQLITERNFVGVIFGFISGISSREGPGGHSSNTNYPIVHGKKN